MTTVPEPKGKVWVLYINNNPKDWQSICEKGKIVSKKDNLTWRYEYPQQHLSDFNNTKVDHKSAMMGGFVFKKIKTMMI